MQTVQQNAKDQSAFILRFLEQRRIGRYRVFLPENFDSTKKYHLIVLLHGNGHTPQLMLRWFRDLHLADVIAVCPEAPYLKLPETLSKGRLQLSAAPNDCGVPDSMRVTVMEESTTWYASVLEDARRHLPLVNELPLLLGFSQGGYYSLMLATHHPNLVRSLVLLSASYYEEAQLGEKAAVLRTHGIDVLHCHARQDPLVAFQVAELIESLLHSQGVKTEFVPFDGGHWMNAEINQRVKEWIHRHNERKQQ